MDIRTAYKLVPLLVAAISFTACQPLVFQTKPEPVPEPVVAEPQEEVTPEPPPPPDNLPASRRVRKALQLLSQGDYENARNQLVWALQEKPGLQIADTLIEQIDADPLEYLGMKNFYYRVESGDSLSIIARKFLDDPMKFVILARYNKLENPSKLAPGDRIRVPGEMPAQIWQQPKKSPPRRSKPKPPATPPETTETGQEQAPVSGEAPPVTSQETIGEAAGDRTESAGGEETPPQPSEDAPAQSEAPAAAPTLAQVLDTARKLHAEGDLPAAIYQLDSEGNRFANEKSLQSLQIDYYKEYADRLMQQDDLNKARDVLEKLVLLDAADEQAMNNLILVEDKLESRKLYQRGNDLLKGGYVEDAYHVLTQSLTYDPDNAKAKQAQILSRDKLTGNYHRQAMQHFRKQELDEAIALWNKILAIDPDHPLASGYKARAVEMQQKLEQIKTDQ